MRMLCFHSNDETLVQTLVHDLLIALCRVALCQQHKLVTARHIKPLIFHITRNVISYNQVLYIKLVVLLLHYRKHTFITIKI
jgi:hypothetical protein